MSEPLEKGKPVSKSNFEQAGLRWPLTIQNGRVGCDGMEYWFKSEDGTRYGLNGLASEEAGYSPIEPIWAFDEEVHRELQKAGSTEEPVVRISISDLIDEAEKVCPSA